jgi:rsbT co-antagonist protein RsbR
MGANFIEILRKSHSVILEKWVESQSNIMTYNDDLISNQEIREQAEELLSAFLKNLNEDNAGNGDAPEFDEVVESLSDLSISRAKLGFSPKETGVFVTGMKNAIMDVLEAEMAGSPAELYAASKKLHLLFDSFNIVTSEISTPVIRVWEGILALPIIGTLDSARTQVVMENLLEAIVETGSSIAILDISGVPAVDSLVAQHLMKTVAATRLMGAECVISGIRPEIAQTIVHLGIDLSNIITKASLAHALRFSFQSLRLEVKKVQIPANR